MGPSWRCPPGCCCGWLCHWAACAHRSHGGLHLPLQRGEKGRRPGLCDRGLKSGQSPGQHHQALQHQSKHSVSQLLLLLLQTQVQETRKHAARGNTHTLLE